jgi:uncharacterized protein DUF1420
MALASSLGALCSVAALAILFAAFGCRLLRWSKIAFQNSTENLLLGAALGVITFEVILSLVAYTGKWQLGIGATLALMFIVAIPEARSVSRDLRVAFRLANRSRTELALASAVGVLLLLQGLAAMAPLTGSDALHYHFPAARFYLTEGFHPDFFLVHSFLLGQSHQLILTGLSLGSEKLAMALLYLGGVLAAAATACVVQRVALPVWAWLAALAFLLTPIVFWQMTSSGAPDVWMAFFATMAVLCIAGYRQQPRAGLALWAGCLAGAVAGAKYSGCIIAAALALAFLWEARSFRSLSFFFGGSLCAGIWPYARNFYWTSDPLFPFAIRWFAPQNVNQFTLASLLLNTGVSRHSSMLRFLTSPFFAASDPARPGFFQYFTPLCLVFAPLVVVAVRNTPLWRVLILVWITSGLGISLTTDMARFLLPVFPIALAASFAALARLHESRWRLSRVFSLATVGVTLVMGASGFLLYERDALACSLGRISREQYLRQHAPDYERIEFVNRTLAEEGSNEKALVFLRHIYYLNVPFVYGDPGASWGIDPEKLQTPEAWLAFFHQQHIRWVVRSPEYPESIAGPLRQLENSGNLIPQAEAQTMDFTGKRMEGVKRSTSTVVLRVQDHL